MAEEKKKFNLSPKQKKIINIVVDVVVAIILVFAVILAVCTIRSRAKGYKDYTEIFGKAYVSVLTDSMEGEKPDWVPEDKPKGFNTDDLISIKLLSEDEINKLEVGDIITFKYHVTTENKQELLTHRIKRIVYNQDNSIKNFVTQGDKYLTEDTKPVKVEDIVGIYNGKASGIGKVVTFMGTSTGFFVCIVLPTLLIVVYCAFNLIIVIKKEKKVQTAEAADEKAQERERIRAELLAEMNAQKGEGEQAEAAEEVKAEDAAPVVVAEEKAEEPAKAEPEEVKAEEVKAEEPAKEEPAEATEEKVEKPAAKKTASKTTAKKPTAGGTAAKKPTASTGAKKPAAKKTAASKDDDKAE